MNRKISREDNSLVFEKFEERVDIKLSPEIKSINDYEESDYLLADLLSWLKSFHNSLFEIRKELKLQSIFKYPKKPTIKNLVGLIFKLDASKRKILESRTRDLLEKYHLTENWEFPIEIAILTHTLLVPPKETGVHLYLPLYFYPKLQENLEKMKIKKTSPIDGLRRELKRLLKYKSDFAKYRQMMEVVKYPAIYFTRQVSIDELKKWIDKNRSFIRAIQYKLPKRKIIKRTQKALFWGQVAWILKKDGIHSWTKMVEKIEELIEHNRERGTIEKESGHFADIPPEPQDLARYYKRFIESLTYIQPR
jgi:hypothetical protein